jgi:uncharacterized protein (DUF1800 family)
MERCSRLGAMGLPLLLCVTATAGGTRKTAKAAALTPLNLRERVVQLLDRFTFGPTPGEVDRVLAEGEDKWVDQQMNPGAIPDDALQRRLVDYPTLSMSAAQVSTVFPDRAQVDMVADGKMPYPTDPLLHAVYEVQLYKRQQELDKKNADGSVQARVEPTDEQKAAQKMQDRETAARVAGELLALPKSQRMAALIKMPVEDRIAFTDNGNLPKDQRDLLQAEFTPREAEVFRAMAGRVNASYNIADELAQGRMLRDVLTERQMQAVMTNFWFNHFNVFIRKDSDQWYTTSYERDVIAKNALGNFYDLLLATAESPAMMVYLDNWQSIGPDSLANGVNPQKPNAKKGNKGLNENYGREVMELHTVGVDGGYTQADVTALAAILTGWGVDEPKLGGAFTFNYKRHEPGPKAWFGYSIDEDGKVTKLAPGAAGSGTTFGPSNDPATPDSVKQGMAALNILASSPRTAHFIGYLLAQYFVADDPPASLVDRLQQSYLASHGDIKTILRILIASPEFNSRRYYRNKVKTPEEFVASAFRATATDPQNPDALVKTIKAMGMPLYEALPPTGYYLTAEQWMNSSALVDRLNFAYQLTNGKLENQRFDAPKLLAMGLLMSSSREWAGAGAARSMAGESVAMRVLETAVIGAPVSAQTNGLIEKQMQTQPANASSTDTLNLLSALVMGSPEFQVR